MTGKREGPQQGWPRKVPGTKHMTCTEDGVLITKCGKPAKVFTTPMKDGRYVSKPRATFTGEDGKRHTMTVEKLVEAARTGIAPKMGWGKYRPNNNAHRKREKAWRRRTLEAMRRDPAHRLHGSASGYKAGCRCERCRNAKKVLIEQVKLRNDLRAMGYNPYTGERTS